MSKKIADFLGKDADHLLNHKAKVPASVLHLPGPDFVDRILSERPQCEARHYLRPIVSGVVGIDQDRVLSALRGCTWKSAEVHELLSRARGGSIVEDANVSALCGPCHRWVTTEPRLVLSLRWTRSPELKLGSTAISLSPSSV